MNMPKKLDKCPRTPECSARNVWQADNGTLFRFDKHDNDFVEHKCFVRNTSEKPTILYLSEWYNEHTKRTRWMGPFRTRQSAEKPPLDNVRWRTRSDNSHWKLRDVYTTNAEWVSVK